jgi:enoyl-[acyl-carrier protein] reductase I
VLADKRLIVTGIATTDSIAFALAERAQLLGAELLLTAFPRDRERAEEAAAQLPREAPIFELDATRDEDFDGLASLVRSRWGGVDGALHAIAFAPRDALSGDFLTARAEGVNLAFQTSAFSYAALGRVVADLAPAEGASLVGLDFDAAGAWPVYNWMGVCKAALESVNRYLARDLGPRGVRANLVAAGPINTRAAGGIAGFDRCSRRGRRRAARVGSRRRGARRRRGLLPALRHGPRDHRRDPPRRRRPPRDERPAARGGGRDGRAAAGRANRRLNRPPAPPAYQRGLTPLESARPQRRAASPGSAVRGVPDPVRAVRSPPCTSRAATTPPMAPNRWPCHETPGVGTTPKSSVVP